MTTQHLIHKWFIYTLGLLPIWMLDCYILCRYPVLGVTPILLPLVVSAVATMEGQISGGAFGMWVGFLWTTTYPVAPGGMIFFLTLFGFLAGKWVQFGLQKGFLGYIICTLAILVAVEFLWIWGFLWRGYGTSMELVSMAGRQVILTLMYTPLVYVLFGKIFRKVGGNRLA